MQSPIIDQSLLQIGQVSRRSGLSIKTIRYYEEIGLIAAVSRSQGGFRQFSPGCLSRLSFIKQAQSLGLSLTEISQILTLHDRGQPPCNLVRSTLQEKIHAIDDRITNLTSLRNTLKALLDQGDREQSGAPGICPIIEQVPPSGV
ncbi:MAG: heavy metal-responsive transcriptional regulator [Nodosilinea sp. LVE1205-7]|jgi:DNA-binding transcriptional MerR regulator